MSNDPFEQRAFLLDFGKSYCNEVPPDHSAEVLDELEQRMKDYFGEFFDEVELAICTLRRYGIYYNDARPGNINCAGLRIESE